MQPPEGATRRGPLHGLKVIELAGIGPGPMACMLLADLGATVLRIDRPDPHELGVKRPARFNLLLRNRQLAHANLKDPEAVAQVLDLVAHADVLVEGYRPGVAERLGLGPDACFARNPGLVYGRMTGWGQDGPLAQAAGHDLNYVALTGVIHAIGRAGQPPAIPLALTGDMGGGALYLVMGILSALIERGRSGRGQVIDAAVVDGAASLATLFYGLHAAGVWQDARGTNVLDSGAPFYDVYQCQDDHWISVGPIEGRFYAQLLAKLDLDPATCGAQNDRPTWPATKIRIAQCFRQRTRQAWCDLLEGSDVCFAPVLSFAEAPHHPHIKARGTLLDVDGVVQPAPAPRFSRSVLGQPSPPLDGPNTDLGAMLEAWSADAGIATTSGSKAMAAKAAAYAAAIPGFRPAPFPEPCTGVERQPDGSLILRSTLAPVEPTQWCLADLAEQWALTRPEQPAFCEPDPRGGWRTLTWGELWRQIQLVGAGLLAWNLGPERPLMMLSGNSLEQLVLMMAAEYVGIPVAPVSPPYSLQGGSFARLREIHDLVRPGLVFVQSAGAFQAALTAIGTPPACTLAVVDADPEMKRWPSFLERDVSDAVRHAVRQARAAIQPADIGRILFTSGSTGAPKGVLLSYANLRSMVGHNLLLNGALRDAQAVMLDWLPWHHVFGWLGNVGRICAIGGTLYIDDGRPTPAHFARTVNHLRSLAPTIFATVPAAWSALVAELECDQALAERFFSRLRYAGYGGASLPRDVYERIQAVAVRTIGQKVVFMTGYGATETTGQAASFSRESDDVGSIGVPTPGVEIKLTPLPGNDGRYEISTRGRHVFPGYLHRPDLTQASFDADGFYRLGDAVRLVDANDPSQGMRFAGRVVEDFKLSSGTWVRTGSVRLQLLADCAPLLSDAVICGHDQSYVAALAWPDVAACRGLSPALATLDAQQLVEHPLVLDAVQRKLRSAGEVGGRALVKRVLLMAEPPSLDANEIADKGYINQAATRARRAHLIASLYQPEPGDAIARAGPYSHGDNQA